MYSLSKKNTDPKEETIHTKKDDKEHNECSSHADVTSSIIEQKENSNDSISINHTISNTTKEDDEFNSLYHLIVHTAKHNKNTIPYEIPLVSPTPLSPTLSIPSTLTDSIKINKIQCDACKKTFISDESLLKHYEKNMACKSWTSHSDMYHTNHPIHQKPIHMLINDYLKKSITGEKDLQCKFCMITFTNIGNHHKHYHTANVCNRMAYSEFRKLVLI